MYRVWKSMVNRRRSGGCGLYLVIATVLAWPAFMSSGGSGVAVAMALDPGSFRSSVGSAIARVQGATAQRIEGGREQLRRYQLALKVRRRAICPP